MPIYSLLKSDLKDAVYACWDIYKTQLNITLIKQSQFRDVICNNFIGYNYNSCMSQSVDNWELLKINRVDLNCALGSKKPDSDNLAVKITQKFFSFGRTRLIRFQDEPNEKKAINTDVYVKLRQDSKYYGQFEGIQKAVIVISDGEYCIRSNQNQYRISDVDFCTKESDGFFVPVNIFYDEVSIIKRLLATIKSRMHRYQSGDITEQQFLYDFSQNEIFQQMEELLSLRRMDEPVCDKCGKLFAYCSCDY